MDIMNVLRTGMNMSISRICIMGMLQYLLGFHWKFFVLDWNTCNYITMSQQMIIIKTIIII